MSETGHTGEYHAGDRKEYSDGSLNFSENSYKQPEIGMVARNGYHSKGQVLVNDVFLDEPVAYGKAGELDVILNTQLLKQTVAISAGCFRAKTEIYGYFLV